MSALIDPESLYTLLDAPGLRLIDATYPSDPAFFQSMRIGKAVRFDIDAVCDPDSTLPHMLPSPGQFAAAIGMMGIRNNDDVVVYDRSGMAFAAARVWWMFRVFGHQKVRVLNGGLPAWCRAGLPLVTTPPHSPENAPYTASFNPALVRTATQVRDSLGDSDTLILDARPPERFSGLAPEPRPGMRSGHIPGSRNLAFSGLIDPLTGTLSAESLEKSDFTARTIISSCGSGVTACVLALALYEQGRTDVSVYDGSWSEWGSDSGGLPVETGNCG